MAASTDSPSRGMASPAGSRRVQDLDAPRRCARRFICSKCGPSGEKHGKQIRAVGASTPSTASSPSQRHRSRGSRPLEFVPSVPVRFRTVTTVACGLSLSPQMRAVVRGWAGSLCHQWSRVGARGDAMSTAPVRQLDTGA